MAADPTKFWPKFNDYQWPEVECGDGSSVAVQVLAHYGVPVAPGSSAIGGPLDNVDIKQLDCMSVIKSSLFDEAAKRGAFLETMVNEEGEVEFVEVGNNQADMDIYYTIQTQTYKEPCEGVMITGQKPLPVRKPIEWLPIWGEEINKHVYDTQGMTANCNEKTFRAWATVVFPDPHMNSAFEDGIDNLYDITKDNPYDKILGYAYFIHHGDNATEDTSIQYQRQAKAVLKVGDDGTSSYGPNLGTLHKRQTMYPNITDTCWFDTDSPDNTAGVEVEIPDSLRFERQRHDGNFKTDNFVGVSNVFVVGIELDECMGQPIDNTEASTEENTRVWIMASNGTKKTLSLSEGVHYTVIYPQEGTSYKTARIVFANNSRSNDNGKYGTDTTYYYIHDGELWTRFGGSQVDGKGTVLPLGGIKGFLIEEVWATIDLDTPSFVITDPKGNARLIADSLEVLVAPIVIEDPPTPIAFNGQLIDQTQGITDNDPTTVQDLTETQFEQALDIMQGGGLTLNFSYLGEEEIKTLSKTLYDYMNGETQIETTYTCGPDSDPKLGDQTPAGIVNSIRYSYSDSGAYTISVNAGPKVIGNFSELSQGVTFKQQNEASGMQGTIIQDEGNNVVFKVRIDGYGDTYAINLHPTILRAGDIVSCTIHNNPVGE